MEYLLEVPLADGGRLVVEAGASQVSPGDLDLAARHPGELVARGQQTLEDMLDSLAGPLQTVSQGLRRSGPSEVTVEFGLNLASEAGAVVAKGTAAVNFLVTLRWTSSS
jgi:hypothetical protein